MTDEPGGQGSMYRADQYPDDCSSAEIAESLDGRRLFNPDLLQKIDAFCQRCEEKNRKRQLADVDREDQSLADGDRVTVHATHVHADDLTRAHWHIARIEHQHHPQLPFDDCVCSGTAFVRATATLRDALNEAHITDVDVTHRSRTDDGPLQSEIDRRTQQYVDDGDEHPDDVTVIDRDPEDPPAHWPQSEREWLNNLIETHGPLQRAEYHIPDPNADDANPGGESR